MGHLIAYVIFKHYFLSSKKTGYRYFVLHQEYPEGCLAVTPPVYHHKHIIISLSLQRPWDGTEMKQIMVNFLKRLAKFVSYIHTPHSVYGCWFSSTLILCIKKPLCIFLFQMKSMFLRGAQYIPEKSSPRMLRYFSHMGLTAHTSSGVYILWA